MSLKKNSCDIYVTRTNGVNVDTHRRGKRYRVSKSFSTVSRIMLASRVNKKTANPHFRQSPLAKKLATVMSL